MRKLPIMEVKDYRPQTPLVLDGVNRFVQRRNVLKCRSFYLPDCQISLSNQIWDQKCTTLMVSIFYG